jgi:hypothetical protein
MENTDLLGSKLEVGDIAAAHLSETAKWGKFLAVVGMVFCILFILLGLFFSLLIGSFGNSYGSTYAFFGPALGIVYILIALLYFFPCLYLLRFSNKMKAALNTDDQVMLNDAFNNHRKLYKFVGILTIIVIGLYVVLIALGGLGSFFR